MGGPREVGGWEAPATVKLHLHGTFNTDIKTPYSNLTAEVEWWRGSSRVPCCIHRILMAVRQKTTGTREALQTKAHCALRCATLARNHTDGVHIRLLSRLPPPLLILCPRVPLPQQGALPALCLILRFPVFEPV